MNSTYQTQQAVDQQQIAQQREQVQQQQSQQTQQQTVTSIPSRHAFMVSGYRFDVDTRYSLIKAIGQGAYGIVCSALDRKTNEKVAIKKITKAFEHLTDTKRTLRELKLCKKFNHENILGIKDILKPASQNYDDIYIISELMDTDLHQIIGSPQPLSDEHCQYFVYQILRGLKYIHSANVLHRDLKPSNLLLNGNCDLKICDFGLARVADKQEKFMTEYVATRWYRAPEIMLSWKEYTKAIDVWSVGCIFAEILGRRPLFPGRDYIHQLMLITDVIGTPEEEDLENIGSEKARKYIRSLPTKTRIPLERYYPNCSPLAIDLLHSMLVFNPAKRITVDEALAHPYLSNLHDPTDEPVCDHVFDFSWEQMDLTRDTLRELIAWEAVEFHPEYVNERQWYLPH